jgi:hypothetical protein
MDNNLTSEILLMNKTTPSETGKPRKRIIWLHKMRKLHAKKTTKNNFLGSYESIDSLTLLIQQRFQLKAMLFFIRNKIKSPWNQSCKEVAHEHCVHAGVKERRNYWEKMQ